MVAGSITVLEAGRRLDFSFDVMLSYHGADSPGGVAHSFKVMERAFPLLDPDAPPERCELMIETAFRGPGARDGFELATRAVSDGRFKIEPALERPERGLALERFVFRLRYREKTITLRACEGFVAEELILLARTENRSAAQATRLRDLKGEMATRVMGAPASEVYDVEFSAK